MESKHRGISGVSEEIFHIRGIICASCVARIEKALSRHPAVQAVTVNLATERVKVWYRNDEVSTEQLINMIHQEGYEAELAKDSATQGPEEARRSSETDQARRRLIIGAMLIAPFVLSTLLEFFGRDWTLSGWLQLLLATPIQFWLGARFYRGAFGAVRRGTTNMDLLVALGTSAASGLSLYHFYLYGDSAGSNGTGYLYFQGSALIIVLVMLGKDLEARVKEKTKMAIRDDVSLARILLDVQDEKRAKAPIQRLADKVSAIFVPLVIVFSGLTLLGWYLTTGNLEAAVMHAVAVLVIACPCALGLATPVSIMVGTGAAAKAGIVFQNPAMMEMAHAVTAVVFEKGGSLTDSHPHIAGILTNTVSEQELMQITAGILRGRDHPLARAVAMKTERDELHDARGSEVNVLLGKGWQGRSGEQLILIGDRDLMHEYGIDLKPLCLRSREYELQGYTQFFIAEQNSRTLLGILALSERVKGLAFDTVQDLHALGIRTIMMTSDHKASAFLTARALGIHEIHADIRLEKKPEVIVDLQRRGEFVAMVGDRAQDAPALAAAQVAITFAKTGDRPTQLAEITLLRDDPHLIADAFHISRRTYSKIKQNLSWAIVYNAIGIPMAAMGLLNPAVAGAAMALSSLLVVTNALQIGCWRPDGSDDGGEVRDHRGGNL